MTNVFAINGSPRGGAWNTAAVLGPCLEKKMEAGAKVERVHVEQL